MRLYQFKIIVLFLLLTVASCEKEGLRTVLIPITNEPSIIPISSCIEDVETTFYEDFSTKVGCG